MGFLVITIGANSLMQGFGHLFGSCTRESFINNCNTWIASRQTRPIATLISSRLLIIQEKVQLAADVDPLNEGVHGGPGAGCLGVINHKNKCVTPVFIIQHITGNG